MRVLNFKHDKLDNSYTYGLNVINPLRSLVLNLSCGELEICWVFGPHWHLNRASGRAVGTVLMSLSRPTFSTSSLVSNNLSLDKLIKKIGKL